MKLIKPYTEIWEQGPGLEGMLRHIEKCARVCYKSEDHIKENTAEKMVKMLIDRGHTAMLEHGTVYLQIVIESAKDQVVATKYSLNKYSRAKYINPNKIGGYRGQVVEPEIYFITTNYRVLVENNWLNDLQYQCEPTEYHEKRITSHFTCDRGISHELVRHRVFSFAQESTRYCNYSKDKFGNELTFIIPSWLNLPERSYGTIDNPSDIQFKQYSDPYEAEFVNGLLGAEFRYMNLLGNRKGGNPWTPQQARTILPNSLKTEVCMTGFVSDWEYFFELRTAQNAHPQMRELTIPLKDIFRNKGLL